MPITHLLCAHDLTHASAQALALASQLASSLGAALTILHVAPPPSDPSALFGVYSVEEMELMTGFARREQVAADQVLKEAVQRLGTTVTPTIVIQAGRPAEAVNAYALAQSIDLIVVGTHGRRGLERAVIGSVAEDLVRSAPCPVLVAHASHQAA